MHNTGCVFANDSSKTRVRAVVANLHRLGVSNCVVTSMDGRHFPKVMGGMDRVLLDAPCSGTGVISKDPSAKMNKVRGFVSGQAIRQVLLTGVMLNQ
jgi:ribosomal RNA methyltransferase Nop2